MKTEKHKAEDEKVIDYNQLCYFMYKNTDYMYVLYSTIPDTSGKIKPVSSHGESL